jgi:tetratricopeptide (TPR) repeat protein
LHSALNHLNLNYGADAKAFESFVRSDSLVDNIRGLENRIKFFDLACRKDPESPYVRQHYARMLHRAGRLELALSQVQAGLDINPQSPPRVLLHTKGIILGDIALQAENVDIGRRRLAQAEEALMRAMRLNRKDEYVYQTLAQIYLNWAKQSLSEEESASYLTKAEETLSTGFSNCREKDGLWITSSEIDKWLGDQPAQLRSLETAVKSSPGSVIARYLLGKTYRRLGRYQDALDILHPNVKNHPDEFRSCIEYALNLLATGKTIREAVAIMEIASATGLSDGRYIAHLGGMYFLSGEYAKATEVFREAEKRELPQDELHGVTFMAKKPGADSPLTLAGKVMRRKPTYSLIEVEGYPPFLCHSSKYKGLSLKEGMKVSFNVGFSPKGPTALEPREQK